MSEHARKAMIEDVEQRLTETIGDFLDSEETQLTEAIGLFCDPVDREETELHIRMAKAAMIEYEKTIKQNS